MMARRVIAGRGGFNPKALFANNEQGVWYDPSDFSTLFQDSAGTTPVTAVEQPVGLMLDKSRGLVLGSELVTNGDFATNLTGWSNGLNMPESGTASWNSGKLRLTRNTATVSYQQALTTVIGKFYKVTGKLTFISGTDNGALYASNSSTAVSPELAAVGTPVGTSADLSLVFLATATTTYIHCVVGSANSTTYDFDNISVKELPGNHAYQSTSTAYRPTLKQDAGGNYYLLFDGTNDYLVTGPINFTSTNKMTVFGGLYKLSDACGIIVELSSTANNPGVFGAITSETGSNFYIVNSKSYNAKRYNNASAPYKFVFSAAYDRGAATVSEEVNLRINAVVPSFSFPHQGDNTGNYINSNLYIGARGGSSLYFNGRLYSLIVRGAQSSANLITATERYVARKTGVTL